jgi:hypothetical protein
VGEETNAVGWYGWKWSKPIIRHIPVFPNMNLNIHKENVTFHSGEGKREGHDYGIWKLYVKYFTIIKKVKFTL